MLFYGWVRAGTAQRGRVSRALRGIVAAPGAVVLFAGTLALLQPLWERIAEDQTAPAADAQGLHAQITVDASVPAPSLPSAAPAGIGAEDHAPAPIRDGGISVLGTLKLLASELGFSLGWGAVCFTLLTVLWNGQTPGKRLLGIRVISLRGEPLSYWAAFERYGGYAPPVSPPA